jgi:hypothetical protein
MTFKQPTDFSWWDSKAIALEGPQSILISRNDNGYVHQPKFPQSGTYSPFYTYQFDDGQLRYIFSVSRLNHNIAGAAGDEFVTHAFGRSKSMSGFDSQQRLSPNTGFVRQDENGAETWITGFPEAEKIWVEKLGFPLPQPSAKTPVPVRDFQRHGYSVTELCGTERGDHGLSHEIVKMAEISKPLVEHLRGFGGKRIAHTTRIMDMSF